MKFTRFAAPLLAAAMMTGAPMMSLAQQQSNQDWNTPPAGTEQAQAGWRDGIQAAQLDQAAHRKLDAHSSFLYQHPKVKKGPERDAYLSQFEAGYNAALQHSNHAGM